MESKTALEKLLEIFPDTPLTLEGSPEYICPTHLGLEAKFYDSDNCLSAGDCKRCWEGVK